MEINRNFSSCDFSFSCGNGLPTMTRFDGVKLIGKPSGGSACSVAAFSDGNAVGFELNESYLYNLPKFNSYLNSIENNA